MVLLTSSQVSVLLSSAIVVSCTAALFLSGYIIQQRTLGQLRQAIKPDSRPSPKASYYVPEHLKAAAADGAGKLDQIVIEVKPTVPERQQQQHQQQGKKKDKAGQKAAGWTSDMWQKMTGSLSEKEEEGGGVSKEDLENMDERERNIEGWKVKDQKNPDPEASNQKPISRAERRRLIKEELRRLAEGQEKVYYQRRLW
ncbi:hypothetical protein LX32DRAFT_109779 [Colletotrichum zoysiae]|uniref:Uncharacterized protein n=1 Tax=Colletotrichum zoysiae TaxID=1216348 RepID=A0AAD9H8B8_9PEZI|nr:hypothetical protein LX32DRAFT_109779 [Colletotrichum zoysiae]